MKRAASESDHPESTKSKQAHWSRGLLASMQDAQYFVKGDNKVTLIKDMYPKAQYHFLVLPHVDIPDLKSTTKEHIGLLKHMEAFAKDHTKETSPEVKFKYGYHAEPSMQRLHLHVISEDFNSPSMKSRKHWNTFTTGFFLDSEKVIEDLEKTGKVDLPSQEKCKDLLAKPLRCHKCSFRPKHMTELKKHVLSHFK